ncbi:LacI family DNA-binding transcriptional regulator [Anaerosphaera multitolerans]|uniref:LacI family DNA-binding transcriptional regulator n=1 Tax=Anaerosphaera multitolerans TaxID=2487351 RepID=UPI00196AA0F6|nr:LacI family DNA-binding transcriptional regulator [Anaerosphaera multitolerans]
MLHTLKKEGNISSIRDISKATGLSIGTISRYINNSGYVSKESAEKIKKAIKELDYVPNENARAIFKNRSNLIGIVVSSLSNPFFAEMAMRLEEKAFKKGYGVILFTTNDDAEKEREALKLLKGYRVRGIITTRTQLKDVMANLKMPVISFETEVNNEIITVSADNFKGGQLAFNHLMDKGCQNILHIRGPKNFEASELRYEGFKSEAKKHNKNFDIIRFDSDFHVSYNLEKNIGDKDITKYDGIFVFNDIAAVLILRYLLERGVKIPEETKVIGFDNSYMGALLYPSLTTIEQSVDGISSKCIDLLVDLIEGKEVKATRFYDPVKLIQREST